MEYVIAGFFIYWFGWIFTSWSYMRIFKTDSMDSVDMIFYGLLLWYVMIFFIPLFYLANKD